MDDKIRIINDAMDNGYVGPKILYKYRPFDNYAFDMLEKNYVFLCVAKNLDDTSECDVSINIKDFIDLETNNLKRTAVLLIIDMIKQYTTDENYELIKSMIMNISRKDGTIYPNRLLDIIFDLKDLAPEFDWDTFVNWLIEIPEKLNEPGIKNQFEDLIRIAYYAKEKLGICSFSELKEEEQFWEEYADNESGYCIEYDVSCYELNKNIFPVSYTDERITDIIQSLVENFIAQMIYGFSYGKIETDKSQYLRLFLTKNTKWSYQKEWRLLGDANEKVCAPKILNIYLGKNVKDENKLKMIEYCKKNKINLIQR